MLVYECNFEQSSVDVYVPMCCMYNVPALLIVLHLLSSFPFGTGNLLFEQGPKSGQGCPAKPKEQVYNLSFSPINDVDALKYV